MKISVYRSSSSSARAVSKESLADDSKKCLPFKTLQISLVGTLKSTSRFTELLQKERPTQKVFSDEECLDFFIFRLPFLGAQENREYQKIIQRLTQPEKEYLKSFLDVDLGFSGRAIVSAKNNQTDLFEYFTNQLAKILKVAPEQVTPTLATLTPQMKVLVGLQVFTTLQLKNDDATGLADAARMSRHYSSRMPVGQFEVVRQKNLPRFNEPIFLLKDSSATAHCIEQCLMLNFIFRFMGLDSKLLTAKGAVDSHSPRGLQSHIDHYDLVINVGQKKVYVDALYAAKVFDEIKGKSNPEEQFEALVQAFDYVRTGVTQKAWYDSARKKYIYSDLEKNENYSPEHSTYETIALANTNNLRYVFLEVLSDTPIGDRLAQQNLLARVQEAKAKIILNFKAYPSANLFHLQEYIALASLAEFKLWNLLGSKNQANAALSGGIKSMDAFLKTTSSEPIKQLLNLYAFEMEYQLKLPQDQLLARAEKVYKSANGVRMHYIFSSLDPNTNDLKSYFPGMGEQPIVENRPHIWLEKGRKN